MEKKCLLHAMVILSGVYTALNSDTRKLNVVNSIQFVVIVANVVILNAQWLLNSNEEEIDHEDEDVENIMKGEIELEVENNTVNTCKPSSTFPTAQAIIKAVTIKTNDKNTPSIPKANEINANNQSHENQAKNKKKNKKKEEKQNKVKENKKVSTTSISQKQTNNEQVLTSSKKRNLASPESNEKSKKQHNDSDHSIIEYSDEDNENDEENMDEQKSSR
jgi:hypothetical protein